MLLEIFSRPQENLSEAKSLLSLSNSPHPPQYARTVLPHRHAQNDYLSTCQATGPKMNFSLGGLRTYMIKTLSKRSIKN